MEEQNVFTFRAVHLPTFAEKMDALAKTASKLAVPPMTYEDAKEERWFDLFYVFDPRKADGYVCRLPQVLAYILCSFVTQWDYAPREEGY